MQLRHLTLATADPETLRPFYAETLGLPVSNTADGFAVAVGRSSIEFRKATAEASPTYHVAFSVPGDSIDAAAEWLGARADLFADDGRTTFRYESLGATAVYAADPAGNVLELLARDGRERSNNAFGPEALLDIGEIGVVVDDVPAAATALTSIFDVDGSPEAEFAYLGDEDGAFVLAAPGRDWFPTEQPATKAPLTVIAEGGEGAVSFDDGRVTVVSVRN